MASWQMIDFLAARWGGIRQKGLLARTIVASEVLGIDNTAAAKIQNFHLDSSLVPRKLRDSKVDVLSLSSETVPDIVLINWTLVADGAVLQHCKSEFSSLKTHISRSLGRSSQGNLDKYRMQVGSVAKVPNSSYHSVDHPCWRAPDQVGRVKETAKATLAKQEVAKGSKGGIASKINGRHFFNSVVPKTRRDFNDKSQEEQSPQRFFRPTTIAATVALAAALGKCPTLPTQNLDVMSEKHVEDYCNVDGDRNSSDTWTGFTRFTILNEKITSMTVGKLVEIMNCPIRGQVSQDSLS